MVTRVVSVIIALTENPYPQGVGKLPGLSIRIVSVLEIIVSDRNCRVLRILAEPKPWFIKAIVGYKFG